MIRAVRLPVHLALVLALVATSVVAGCVPAPPSPPPTAVPTAAPTAPPAPLGWTEHTVEALGIAIALPDDWLVFRAADIADATLREGLQRDFVGAEHLFGRLDAQGRQAEVLLVGVDPRARGTGRFAPNVTVIAVEPALPPLLLGIGADFAISALRGAFAIETEVERGPVDTPVGEGIGIRFDHRLAELGGGPGTLVEHDGVLGTTGSASFLISRNVAAGSSDADVPSLARILASVRVLP